MRLYIAEKPSLGRAIADALPGTTKKEKGFIKVGDHIVTWCIGHLLEQAAPDAYGEQYKRWRRETLPIVPQKWQWQVKPGTRAQLSVVKKLLKSASTVVHAGDPDREGQLLVDEVLHYLGWKGPTERILISDLNLKAVKKSLSKLRSNKEFIGLSTSALARARADWLYGMNLTRAWTIAAKKQNIQSVLSVGRVQTPLLGLIVQRDDEIQAFNSIDFFDIRLKVTDTETTIETQWLPKYSANISLSPEGHAIDRAQVNAIALTLPGQPVELMSNEHQAATKKAPLAFSLSKLQIAAGSRFNLRAKEVLEACQSLYEKHKLITYPRSDNEYIPDEHHQDAEAIINATIHLFGDCAWRAKLDSNRKSRTFNSKKVGAHHAIIPTLKSAEGRQLNKTELSVYRIICERYLAQFMPDYQYCDNLLNFLCNGHRFKAKARKTLEAGWHAIQANTTSELIELPDWQQGQILMASTANVVAKKTKPPSHYNDATLIAAMSNIARFVTDAELKKTLSDTDGLGTEATRASMIETLDKRGYIIRTQRTIMSTELGRALIRSLPVQAITPDMTAIWEQSLQKISEQKQSYAQFMQDLLKGVEQLVDSSDTIEFEHLKAAIGVPSCRICNTELKRKKSKRGWYWECTKEDCDFRSKDNNGIPGAAISAKTKLSAAKQTGVMCPSCQKPLVERRSARGNFWGCSGYPACKHTQPAGRTTLDIR